MTSLGTLSILLCGSAFAQTPSGAYRVGSGVTAPLLEYRQEPSFSEEARVAKLTGTVRLAVVIGTDGQIHNWKVVKSLGLGLDESAVAAVSNWRFTPGAKAGVPVPVESTIEINFNLLLNSHEWHTSRVVLSAPPDATQPALLHAGYPPPTEADGFGTVRVSFTIDTAGVPANIQVDDSSDPRWNDEVIALIREWRFQAALDHGTAVESRGVIDLTRGMQPPVPAAAPMMKKQ